MSIELLQKAYQNSSYKGKDFQQFEVQNFRREHEDVRQDWGLTKQEYDTLCEFMDQKQWSYWEEEKYHENEYGMFLGESPATWHVHIPNTIIRMLEKKIKSSGEIMSDKNLRNKLIRLAHAKPELRKHLLPILKEASSAFSMAGNQYAVPDEGTGEEVYVTLTKQDNASFNNAFQKAFGKAMRWLEQNQRASFGDASHADRSKRDTFLYHIWTPVYTAIEEFGEQLSSRSYGAGSGQDSFYSDALDEFHDVLWDHLHAQSKSTKDPALSNTLRSYCDELSSVRWG